LGLRAQEVLLFPAMKPIDQTPANNGTAQSHASLRVYTYSVRMCLSVCVYVGVYLCLSVCVYVCVCMGCGC
jgi:hypothetical protein